MPELALVALGGTISMRVRGGLARPELHAADLAGWTDQAFVCAEDLAHVGGSEVDYTLLSRLAHRIDELERDGVQGIVVTVGTDAIEETASWLTYTGPRNACVVVTGSMVPGGVPGSDGQLNLRGAVAVSRYADPGETLVAFAGKVLLGRAAVKVSGTRRDAFASPGVAVIGSVAADGDVSLSRRPPAATTLGLPGDRLEPVPLLAGGLSDGSAGHIAVLPHAAAMTATGAGNLPEPLAGLAQQMLDAGHVVGIATRASDHSLAPTYGYPGGSGVLQQAGAVLAEGMSPLRLRAFLILALSRDLHGTALSDALTRHVEALA